MSTLWDPLGDTITPRMFDADCSKIEQQLRWYRANPDKVKRRWLLLVILFFVGMAGIFASILTDLPNMWGAAFAVMALLPAIAYFILVFDVYVDVMYLGIAQRRKWVYSPLHHQERMQRIISLYPQIMKRVSARKLENELWGNVDHEGTEYSLWMGCFMYRRGRGWHDNQSYLESTLVGIKLPEPVQAGIDLDAVQKQVEEQGCTLLVAEIKDDMAIFATEPVPLRLGFKHFARHAAFDPKDQQIFEEKMDRMLHAIVSVVHTLPKA